ncbi:MAG: hypothetical protein APF76_15335 [Desulfitibacter sp. BRH_c19]|nr:MAG: hypothetical protein APF76_15335 [Desulfitibacter sp. BRH_c19]
MTRLTEVDLKDLNQQIRAYDRRLLENCGVNLAEIAVSAAGITIKDFKEAISNSKVAVVPITSGQGIIGNFSQSIQSFINYLGFHVFVTNNYDVSGIAEAINRDADIIFMADDNQFIAINLASRKVVDNGEATGKGFVKALSLLSNGLKNCEVLVVGAGIVGSHCIDYLLNMEAKVAVCDIDKDKLSSLNPSIIIEESLSEAIPKYKYIIDASPEKAFMTLNNLHQEAKISAPGMPLGVSDEAYEVFKNRIIHDPLQIGVVTMLAMAVQGANNKS